MHKYGARGLAAVFMFRLVGGGSFEGVKQMPSSDIGAGRRGEGGVRVRSGTPTVEDGAGEGGGGGTACGEKGGGLRQGGVSARVVRSTAGGERKARNEPPVETVFPVERGKEPQAGEREELRVEREGGGRRGKGGEGGERGR